LLASRTQGTQRPLLACVKKNFLSERIIENTIYLFRRATASMYRANDSGFPGGAISNVILILSVPAFVFVNRKRGVAGATSLTKTMELESLATVTL
jgi:hypothetical protein